MRFGASGRPSLVLGTIALHTDPDASIRAGQLNKGGPELLACLRAEPGPNYVVRRRGNRVEIAAVNPDLPIPCELTQIKAGDFADLLGWRLLEWLL